MNDCLFRLLPRTICLLSWRHYASRSESTRIAYGWNWRRKPREFCFIADQLLSIGNTWCVASYAYSELFLVFLAISRNISLHSTGKYIKSEPGDPRPQWTPVYYIQYWYTNLPGNWEYLRCTVMAKNQPRLDCCWEWGKHLVHCGLQDDWLNETTKLG